MSKLPSIMVSVPTYNRTKYLKNLVKMFLDQDYQGEKELFLFNDDPDVCLECNHSEVRIINWPHKFADIVHKVNMGILFCDKDIFFPFSDDDLLEPWALTSIVKALGDDLFVSVGGYKKKKNNSKVIFCNGGPVFAVKREAWNLISGGYPRIKNLSAIDVCVQDKFKEIGIYKHIDLDPKEYFFTLDFSDNNRREGVWDTPDAKYIEIKRSPKVFKIEI